MDTAEQGAATALATSVSFATHSEQSSVTSRHRVAGLLIVLAVAFLGSVVSSVLTAREASYTYPDALLGYRYFQTLLHQLVSLGLLVYVVRQNRQGMADLGLTFQTRDIAPGIILWGISSWGYRLLSPIILSACEWLGWHRTAPYLPGSKLNFGVVTICFILVNPIFEEMIVRAYLMSETIALTGSSSLAVLVSVLLQTSYHLYQGVPYALALGLVFLVFSIYYARTRRILPVIAAHFLADLFFHLHYILHHAA